MYWKFLRAGAVSPFTGFVWPTTGASWVQAEGATVCQTGIHACRRADLPYWLTDELWAVELAEPIVHGVHKVVAARARLLGRVESWTPEAERELAEACVVRTARHAADELRAAGLNEEADRLTVQPTAFQPTAFPPTAFPPTAALARVAGEIVASLPGRRAKRAAELCRYVIDAVEGMPVYPGATIAYIAARAANRRSGPPGADRYAEEREWQAAWLNDRLGFAIAT